jgi:hypothetical protein
MNSRERVAIDDDTSGFGAKMPVAPCRRVEFQMYRMIIVAGATRQDTRQLSRRERTNLQQKFYRLRRFAAQGVSLEAADARLDEIA